MSGIAIARARIADCFQTDALGRLVQRRDALNLAGLGLTDDELGQRFVPGERKLPELGLADLVHLRYLDLTGNRLTRLPDGVTGFRRLRWLGLNFNAIASLPDELEGWGGMERLYLRGNQLTRLPDALGRLPRLLELDLHGNALESLPTTFIQSLERGGPDGKPGQTALYLELGGNPLQAAFAAGSSRETLLGWLRGLKEKAGRPEGKLLLVGEGRVGKSSLLRALVGEEHDPVLNSTHGLKIQRWEVGKIDGWKESVWLNCWDFSGQESMRETHQMFFTAPALYLLVWDPDRGQHGSEEQLYEWLWLIHQCQREGARARVLVVATNHRSRDRHLPDNKSDLEAEFGPEGAGILMGFQSVESSDRVNGGREGIDQVQKWVREQIGLDRAFAQEVPAHWEEAVAGCLKAASPVLRWSEFVTTSARSIGSSTLEAEPFARTMHALGRIVWFDDDPLLRDWVVLRPDWLSKAISYVFEKATSAASKMEEPTPLGPGLVTLETMNRIWTSPGTVTEEGKPEPGYDPAVFPVFRRLMTRFDLIQSLTSAPTAGKWAGREPDRYLVPARLGGKPDNWERDWNAAGTVTLRFVLKSRGWKAEGDEANLNPWIAQGLFWRLIIRLHPYAQGRESIENAAHWKHGLRLRDRTLGVARLRADQHQIYFEGSSHLVGWVATALTSLIRDINERFGTAVRAVQEVGCQPMQPEGKVVECSKELGRRRYFLPEELREIHQPSDGQRPETDFRCAHDGCRHRIDVIRTLHGVGAGSSSDPHLDVIDEKLDRIACGINAMRGEISDGFNRMDDLLGAVGEKLEESRGELTESVRRVVGEFLPSWTQGFAKVLRSWDEDVSRQGPILFSLQTGEDYSFWTDLGPRLANKVVVHLHCEHTLLPASWIKGLDGSASTDGRFEMETPKEWVSKAGPPLKGLIQLLGAGAILTVAAGYSDAVIKPVLDALKSVPADRMAGAAKLPKSGFESGMPWDPKGAERADGEALKRLHQLLRRRLNAQDLVVAPGIGLSRVWNRNSARYAWVHPRYAHLY